MALVELVDRKLVEDSPSTESPKAD